MRRDISLFVIFFLKEKGCFTIIVDYYEKLDISKRDLVCYNISSENSTLCIITIYL